MQKSTETAALQKKLSQVGAISKKELGDILHSFPDPLPSDKTQSEFLMIRCTLDDVREDDFIELLLSRIVHYILKRDEYQPIDAGGKKLIELDSAYSIVSRARRQFLRKSKGGKSGEIGELMLFVVLESKGMVQLLNKMNLKTDRDMPVHGLDAIHLEVDGDKVILHYGEAKTYANFQQALGKAVGDLDSFHDDLTQKKVELNLVSSYIDESKFGKHTKQIKDYLRPYKRRKDNFGTCNSVLIGFDWDELKNIKDIAGTNLTEHLARKYRETHREMSGAVKEKVSKSKIAGHSFKFFIIPIRDIGEFRTRFLKAIKDD